MAIPVRVISETVLADYEKQFRALHKDWHYLYKLIQAYCDPQASAERRRALEMGFLALKGRISCDYSVLTAWRSRRNRCGLCRWNKFGIPCRRAGGRRQNGI